MEPTIPKLDLLQSGLMLYEPHWALLMQSAGTLALILNTALRDESGTESKRGIAPELIAGSNLSTRHLIYVFQRPHRPPPRHPSRAALTCSAMMTVLVRSLRPPCLTSLYAFLMF